MRLGYLAQYSEAEVAWAREAGFGSLELLVPPGAPLAPDSSTLEARAAAKEKLAEADIQISALGHYPNMLDPDPDRRAANSKYLLQLMDVAVELGVGTVCTFAGCDPELDLLENIPVFKEVWTPLAAEAEQRGIKLGFENCPMFRAHPFRSFNIAYSPRAWDAMFEAVDSPALGLEYDPSHMVALQMDYLMLLREYGSKIVHVHAKDGERLPEVVRKYGIFDFNSYRDRIPGMGKCNWGAIISTLHEVGYEGNVDIEGRHDPIYHGPRENEGLVLALRHLSQFVATEYVHGDQKEA